MTTERTIPESGPLDPALAGVMGRIEGIRDVLSVRRVFGEAYEVGGVTVIPVASVRGGAGGGGGEGSGPGGTESGAGIGMGYGVSARPVGVYAIRDGQVTWQPALDVMRLALGGQVLAGLALVIVGRLLRRRRD